MQYLSYGCKPCVVNGVMDVGAIDFEIGIFEVILSVAFHRKGASPEETWSDTFNKMNALFVQFMKSPPPPPMEESLGRIRLFPSASTGYGVTTPGPPATPATVTSPATIPHTSSVPLLALTASQSPSGSAEPSPRQPTAPDTSSNPSRQSAKQSPDHEAAPIADHHHPPPPSPHQPTAGLPPPATKDVPTNDTSPIITPPDRPQGTNPSGSEENGPTASLPDGFQAAASTPAPVAIPPGDEDGASKRDDLTAPHAVHLPGEDQCDGDGKEEHMDIDRNDETASAMDGIEPTAASSERNGETPSDDDVSMAEAEEDVVSGSRQSTDALLETPTFSETNLMAMIAAKSDSSVKKSGSKSKGGHVRFDPSQDKVLYFDRLERLDVKKSDSDNKEDAIDQASGEELRKYTQLLNI